MTVLVQRPAALACRPMRRTSALELVQAASRRDAHAWHELVSRFTPMIRSVVRSYRLGEADVDDVVGTTWLRAVENLQRVEDPAKIGGWLATVARREALRLLRAGARTVPTDCDVLDVDGERAPPLDAALLAHERRAAVRRALGALAPRRRLLLELLHADAKPGYDTIATTLGIPIGSIGPTRSRALAQARERLQALGYASAA